MLKIDRIEGSIIYYDLDGVKGAVEIVPGFGYKDVPVPVDVPAPTPNPEPTSAPTPSPIDTAPLQGTKLVFGKWPPPTQHFRLRPNESKLFHVTAPACATARKELKFSVAAQQSMPASHVLVKKVNGNPSAVPTRNDYDKFKALTGGGGGPYVDCGPDKGDGTCDSTGNFFWSFSGTSSLELAIVYSSYLNRLIGPPISLRATVPNFQQADDYYLFVVNTGSTKSTEVYLRVYCD